ncbi:DUF2515 family protein [Mangrovibacillus cuniculi]|uniref:DUF2515 family protein n=1 Tax=Mangrovibacillus cuniculi TaxID=2593652 RepID=A0A7S8HF76_9BACI|nr:DUF2515 family protein [Mangrovibacillus cuniculi]QPC46523.1 DUF2515 family protein [Mangrovibacillus cuniculi]
MSVKTNGSSPIILFPETRELVKNIQKKTETNNRNNVTRTAAYLSFFHANPEVHWAFLAHMVSRNGGYQMTDLKGDILPSVLSSKEIDLTFSLLETANAWIFKDAYPQLLMWEFCKKKKEDLFPLLSLFSVSKFMIEKWQQAFQQEIFPSMFMTCSLIINEQKMLQTRLLDQSSSYVDLFHSLKYRFQEKMGWTDIVFPKKTFWKNSLYGISIDSFLDDRSRIQTGFSLYKLLFQSNDKVASYLSFATNQPHTASRQDYWPFHFSSNRQKNNRIFSPSLKHAWEDRSIRPMPTQDWYIPKEELLIKDFYEAYTISKNGFNRSRMHKSAWKKKDWLTSYLQYKRKNAPNE